MSNPSLRRTVWGAIAGSGAALAVAGLAAGAALGSCLGLDSTIAAIAALAAGGIFLALGWRARCRIAAIVELIERGEQVTAQAAQGDFNTRVLRIGRRDELGRLMIGLNRVLDLTEEFAKDAGAAMKMAGQKHYYRHIPLQGLRGDYLGYAEGINKVLGDMEARDQETIRFEETVRKMVGEVAVATVGIGQTARTMAERSESAGGRSLDVGEAAEVTNERADSVSTSTSQLAAAINEIAQQISQMTDVAQTAVGDIDKTVARMTGLASSISQIGEVVQLIHDIASQTNLLALNATIEAARAGEAGKGFAVVANEVKNLSNQTAKATDDITRQVDAVREAAQLAASGINEVVETIRNIDVISATIAGAIQEQEAVTREISAHIADVAAKASEVSIDVAHMSKASARACGGTIRVIWSAQMLSAVVDSLNQQVTDYVGKVR